MIYKMPHSKFKDKYCEFDECRIMCCCGHTLTFASKKEEKMKLRLHRKFCPNPQKYEDIVDVNKPINSLKAMTEEEYYKFEALECYMDWFPSLISKNYIFKHFVKTVEPMSLKFCTIIELITLHLEYTVAQVKYANFSYAHAQTFVLLNGEMATVSTGFRKLKFWLWLLWTVFYLNQTGF